MGINRRINGSNCNFRKGLMYYVVSLPKALCNWGLLVEDFPLRAISVDIMRDHFGCQHW